eukprot:gene15231-21313_t
MLQRASRNRVSSSRRGVPVLVPFPYACRPATQCCSVPVETVLVPLNGESRSLFRSPMHVALYPVCRTCNGPGQTLCIADSCPMNMKRSDWCIHQFILHRKIGAGGVSAVYRATCISTGCDVAIKMYKKKKLDSVSYDQIKREIKIHSQLSHKNIIQMYAAFEDYHGIYFVRDFADMGDLLAVLQKHGGVMGETAVVDQIIYPTLCALEYLHDLNLIHGDIKPENIFLTAAGVLKVADIRLSIDTTPEEPTESIGTRSSMAPEVTGSQGSTESQEIQIYTRLDDVGDVGMLAYEILTGVAPVKRGQQTVATNIPRLSPAIPLGMSKEAANFIELAMEKDPPTARQLQAHPWIQDRQIIVAIDARASRLRSPRKFPATFSKPSSPVHQRSPAPVVPIATATVFKSTTGSHQLPQIQSQDPTQSPSQDPRRQLLAEWRLRLPPATLNCSRSVSNVRTYSVSRASSKSFTHASSNPLSRAITPVSRGSTKSVLGASTPVPCASSNPLLGASTPVSRASMKPVLSAAKKTEEPFSLGDP